MYSICPWLIFYRISPVQTKSWCPLALVKNFNSLTKSHTSVIYIVTYIDAIEMFLRKIFWYTILIGSIYVHMYV
jgi:hypothetical protein